MDTLKTMVESGKEFMEGLIDSMQTINDISGHLSVSVSTLHREMEESDSVIEYSLDHSEFVRVRLNLDRNQVMDFMEFVLQTLRPVASIPDVCIDQIRYLVDNAFSDDNEIEGIEESIKEAIHVDAEFRGLASRLTFITEGDGKLSLTYSLLAEIFSDTEAEDRAELAKMGVEGLYIKSTPEKLVTLMTQTVTSLHSAEIMEMK